MKAPCQNNSAYEEAKQLETLTLIIEVLYKLQQEAEKNNMTEVSMLLDSTWNSLLTIFYFMRRTKMFAVLTPEQLQVIEDNIPACANLDLTAETPDEDQP